MRSRSSRTVVPSLLLALLAATACGGDAGEDGVNVQGVQDEPASAVSEVPGSASERGGASQAAPSMDPSDSTAVPPGGLERWVAELRVALEPVELDPRNSYDEVLRLYRTYQRNIVRFYGEGGELTGDAYPELAGHVENLEAAFEELLELTELTVRLRVERSELLNAIHAVKTELTRILDRARAMGVPLELPTTRSLPPPTG